MEEGVCLLETRHPLLALVSLRQRKDERGKSGGLQQVRPLDIVLRPGERPSSSPAATPAGKTVCLKTLACAWP